MRFWLLKNGLMTPPWGMPRRRRLELLAEAGRLAEAWLVAEAFLVAEAGVVAEAVVVGAEGRAEEEELE